jgi:cobalt/nickel transport system permease protein
VAEQTGFLDTAVDAPFQILPDYTVSALGETGLSTVVAGIVGALVVAGVTFGVGRVLRR